ncbi:porin [Pandoraea apista]|uniref:Porin n=1 Tax=Pandoraea apista TaxID=93218 RepID=A0ABX9ZVU9_9BURK|nr:porin [Pandoraea apista]PTE01959.1 porin [Pandoraea apista]RRJ32901.1 porin [Pandoraea apista]RRJ81752.1 porin [Pandoraea apista]RSD11130.1 porin [Pandoraea apista]RSK86292.1 porin [Pandoraea apista]
MSHTPICVRTGAHLRPRRPVRITLTSLAAGTLLAVGCNAAQADVQLYGAVDNYVSYDSGGKGSSTQVGSGAGSTSRFGLTGTEDLGGGLTSGFRLESGFNANNGTLQSTNTIFNREANVWLSSHRYGMLKLGRQFPTIFPLSSQVDPYALTKLSLMANVAYATSDLGGNAAGIDSRVANAVSYTTPDMNGFSGQVLYGFSTASASGAPAHYTGYLAQYEGQRLYAGLSYNVVRSDLSQATDHYGAGLSYKIGSTTLSLAYNRIVPSIVTGRIATTYLVGATVPVGPHVFKLSVVERLVAGGGNQAFGALGGYDYQLSKRTALYARMAWIDNGGASALTLDNAQTSAGRDVFVTALGVTHRF